MSQYFENAKRLNWTIEDAYRDVEIRYHKMPTELRLRAFNSFLKEHNNDVANSWLTNWNSFCKKIENAEVMVNKKQHVHTISQTTNRSNELGVLGPLKVVSKKKIRKSFIMRLLMIKRRSKNLVGMT
jgi:hypothetical protein